MDRDYYFNSKTGEVIEPKDGEEIRIVKKGVKGKVLSEFTLFKEDLVGRDLDNEIWSYIKKTMYQTKNLFKGDFIRYNGKYFSVDMMEIMDDKTYCLYLIRMVKLTSCRNFIKINGDVNQTHECCTWKDLYETLGIKSRTTQNGFKKFLLKNDVVRVNKRASSNKDVIVVNPNLYRSSSNASSFCIATFKDVTLKHIHRYCTYYLYGEGLIDFDDLLE